MNICLAGYGLIGSVWERHYREAGYSVAVWSRTPRSLPNYVAHPREAVAGADVIHLVVSAPPAVRLFLRRALPSMKPGALVLQSTTIDPASAESFHTQVMEAGGLYLEAPFTGSKPAAESRQLVFFTGGSSEARERAEPLLNLLSTQRIPFETPGQAAAIKLAMNLQIASVMEALAEGLHLAQSYGIEQTQFFEVLERNVAHSKLADFKRAKLESSDFSPQFSVKWLLKDLRLALGSMPAGELPATRSVAQQLRKAVACGLADQDFAAMVTLFRSWKKNP
ncbi:MAG: NAD(P)-dependent oxidoreductase [Candidatus Methylacidiphilales bacterium]